MVMALVMMSFVLVARLVPAVARAQGIGRQIDVVEDPRTTADPDDDDPPVREMDEQSPEPLVFRL